MALHYTAQNPPESKDIPSLNQTACNSLDLTAFTNDSSTIHNNSLIEIFKKLNLDAH